jgi:hypothetical protein
MVQALKRAIEMKKLLAAFVFVVLALWIGYSRGYHQGIQEERRAWEVTAPVELPGRLLSDGKVTLDSEAAHLAVVRAYGNPRSGVIKIVSGSATMNVPDPRNYPRHEGSSR